jgi:hypothetical protein
MSTIIWMGLGWIFLSAFVVWYRNWMWSRIKAHEKRLLQDRDTLSECEELCPRFDDCDDPLDCLLEKDKDAYTEVI